jgi:DNA-binding beta-propeller fold protein YncE
VTAADSPLKTFIFFAAVSIISSLFSSCQKDPAIINISGSGYPEKVGKIMLTKCAVQGCHNDRSFEAAGNLNLTTWDEMFKGSRTGAVAIPFNHRKSSLFLFVNTFDELGVSMKPTMPVNAEPLTKEEVITLRDWIDQGAPNDKGFVKFSDNPSRKKIYINNQGCDNVAVIDQESKLIMRFVSVGNKPQIEAPHMVKISPDGKYWYVIFTASDIIQRFRTSDDSFAGEIFIGQGNWNTFSITGDSKTAFIVDWSSSGKIAVVDLDNMTFKRHYQGAGLFTFPHGSAISPDNKFLYVTAQSGNYIYKIDISNIDFPEIYEILLAPGQPVLKNSSLDPHFIEISPDGKSYHVVCQASNEIRIMDIETDALLGIIPTGDFPQELTFSSKSGLAFVSCTEDTRTFAGRRGSVTVYNYQSKTTVKSIYTGHQPHGIAADDEKMLVYVANRNIDANGPAPHHVTDCGGRNGYMTVIDINTLELLSPKRYELSVDPYFVEIRK